jgi:hypothetical protein
MPVNGEARKLTSDDAAWPFWFVDVCGWLDPPATIRRALAARAAACLDRATLSDGSWWFGGWLG